MLRTALMLLTISAAAALIATGGCESDGGDGSGPSIDGVWDITSYVSGGEPGEYPVGIRQTLVIALDNTFEVYGPGNTLVGSGTFVIDGDQVTFTTTTGNPPSGWVAQETVTFTITGDSSSMTVQHPTVGEREAYSETLNKKD